MLVVASRQWIFIAEQRAAVVAEYPIDQTTSYTSRGHVINAFPLGAATHRPTTFLWHKRVLLSDKIIESCLRRWLPKLDKLVCNSHSTFVDAVRDDRAARQIHGLKWTEIHSSRTSSSTYGQRVTLKRYLRFAAIRAIRVRFTTSCGI